jgi:hypothetical protein
MGSVTRIHIMTVTIVTCKHEIYSSTQNCFIHTSVPGVGSTTGNESILSPLSKQTESFTHHVGKTLLSFPSMAWLFLAWLAQIHSWALTD